MWIYLWVDMHGVWGVYVWGVCMGTHVRGCMFGCIYLDLCVHWCICVCIICVCVGGGCACVRMCVCVCVCEINIYVRKDKIFQMLSFLFPSCQTPPGVIPCAIEKSYSLQTFTDGRRCAPSRRREAGDGLGLVRRYEVTRGTLEVQVVPQRAFRCWALGQDRGITDARAGTRYGCKHNNNSDDDHDGHHSADEHHIQDYYR